MEQLVLLLIIALISFINWLMQRAAEAREKRRAEKAKQRGEFREEMAPAADSSELDNPEEAMRKLMEALGLPLEEEPPKVQKAPPPAPLPEVAPPPLRYEPEKIDEPVSTPSKVSAFPQPAPYPQSPTPRSKPLPVPALSEAPGAAPRARFRELLKSRAGLRDAFILSEILSRPMSLRN